MAPLPDRTTAAPTITARTEKNPSEERSFALTLRHLAEGIGVLVLLAIAGVAWAKADLRRRLAKAPPMSDDSEEFTAALKDCTAMLPNNPRTTIRFNNAARFLYHLVGVAHPQEKGWETGFFQILFSRWSQRAEPEPKRPPPKGPDATEPQVVTAPPAWLAPEMQTWISVEHRAFKAAQSGDG